MSEREIELDLEPIESWLPGGKHRPVVMAGPCSAESEAQVIATARTLAEIPFVHIFRAGVWKPRTRPNSFEGVGEKALDWLVAAKSETGLATAVEVAHPRHVEACLKKGIDVLWLGARTVVSPFAVQELAEALRGTNTPVLVKNPLVPELALWIGALERLNQAGLKRLVAVHRGFANYLEKRFRYSPEWSIPNQLRAKIPQLPIFCDPSHIAGKRELIPGIAKEALSFNAEGLMLETHITPESALSDADQQLTPTELRELLDDLGLRPDSGAAKTDFGQIQRLLENRIQHLDRRLIELLSARIRLVQDIRAGDQVESNLLDLQLRKIDELLANQLSDRENSELINNSFISDLVDMVHGHAARIPKRPEANPIDAKL